MIQKCVLLVLAVALSGNACAQNAPGNPPAANPPAETKNYRYWTTDWSFKDIDLNDLLEKLRWIGVELPISVAGHATVQFKVSVPINGIRTARAYKIKGMLSVRELVADEIRFDRFRAEVSFDQGKLELTRLHCAQQIDRVGNDDTEHGTLDGSATAKVIPRGDFAVNATAKDLALGPISALMTRLSIGSTDHVPGGQITAEVSLSGAVDDLSSPERWTIVGDLNATNLSSGGEIRFNVTASGFSLRKRRLNIPRLRIESAQRPEFFIDAEAKCELSEDTRFEIELQANDIPMAGLLELVSSNAETLVDGKLDVVGTANGVIGGPKIFEAMDVQLAVASPSICVGRVDLGLLEHDVYLTTDHFSLRPREPAALGTTSPLKIDFIEMGYQLTEQAIRISNLDAKIFGGQFKGKGQFARHGHGTHRAEVSWSGLEPEVILPLAVLSKPMRLSVQTSGDVNWTAPADRISQPASHRGKFSAKLQHIRIANQDVGEADLELSIDQSGLKAGFSGKLFGGDASVRAQAPLDQISRWGDVPAHLELNEFSFSEWSIRRLLQTTMIKRPRFDGRLSGTVQFEPDRVDRSLFKTQLRLGGLTSESVLVARNLDVALRWDGSRIIIDSAKGDYAGGQLQADGLWTLGPGDKLVTLRLTRADAGRILLPVNEAASSWVDGIVSGRATVNGYGDGGVESIRITGALNVRKNVTFGMPIGQAHSPFSVAVETSPIRWKTTFPQIRSELAGGRLTGRLSIASAAAGRSGLNIDSSWRMNHVDFEELLQASIGTNTIGRGNLTGDFQLKGRYVRSAKDLEGRIRIRLGGTDASAVPGLSAAGALMGATSLVGVRFEHGEAVARIAKGRLLLEEVSLTSDRVSVRAAGTVALIDRQMNIDAVIATGSFQGQNFLLRQVGEQVLVGAIPIGRANRILSDRTIVIKLVGPTRDPVIRLMTAETLQANVRRFAIQETLGIVVADSLLFD